MKRKYILAALVISFIVISSLQAASKLSVQVITSSPEGFLVNSTLIMGKKEAILIDGQFTVADAQKAVAAIQASKKNLTTIYVPHSHPDHYFGLNVLQAAFPKAKIVATPATIQHINATWKAKVDQWKPMYGDALPDQPIIPETLTVPSLLLEGNKIEIVEHVQGDETENTFVWIPSLKTVITGDIVYDGVYPWTAETSPAQRQAWMKAIDQIAALSPSVVIPGHQTAGAVNNTASLAFMKDYLTLFDQALASSTTADELIAKIKEKYPNLALDIVLKIGAGAALPPKKK